MTQAMALDDSTDWHEDALATIIGLAQRGQFTADDLRREMRPAPHPNHVGSAFTAAKKLGFIEAAGYTTSTTTTRRHGVIRTWRHAADKGVAL